MRELSIFIDESGDIGSGSQFYLLVLVLHDQADSIQDDLSRLSDSLSIANLPNIPFHFTPVLRGHDQYATLSIGDRKSLLARFRVFTEKCPVSYRAFVYRKRDFSSFENLGRRMEKELETFLRANLAYFQQYDRVKVYYDNGQRIVRDSLHTAIDKTISRNAIEYKEDATPKTYRLFQMADYVCGIELTAARYENNLQGPSEMSFFGGTDAFKKNWLKKLRRKQW